MHEFPGPKLLFEKSREGPVEGREEMLLSGALLYEIRETGSTGLTTRKEMVDKGPS